MSTKFIALFAACSILSFNVLASGNSPVGLWKNIDDETGKPKALIRITENGGEYKGKIEKLFREPGEDQNPLCTKCSGELKDKQILGMTMLTNLRQDGDEYTGGEILDAKNGQVYKSKITVIEGGKKLSVRGYIGIPLIGRSQVWVREE